jgi:hypothetical protein
MGNGLRKILVPSWAALLLLARSASAQAPTPGMHQSGGFILSAERLFGLSFWSVKQEQEALPGVPGSTATESTATGTHVSLLYGATLAGVTENIIVPYTTPRLAFDFLPIESLTLGGSIGFVSATGSEESTNSPSRDSPSLTGIAFSPRVGYALMLTEGIHFWPRLGVTYYSLSSESTSIGPPPTTSSVSYNGFAINIEPSFVFSPVPHFGITVMPVADIPLSGSRKSETPTQTTERSFKITNFGATIGILGYF